MYSKLPSLALGFHGCDKKVRDLVLVEGKELRPSTNDYDWLGSGIYFWEQNYERAMEWAQEQTARGVIEEPAVIGAVIDLGFCLNLTDSRYIELIAKEYETMLSEFELLGLPLRENRGGTSDKALRGLDCQVIEHLHARIRDEYEMGVSSFEPFDSARGLFSEGDPIFPDAGFKEKTHVQICVRNPNCIKGYFAPRKPNPHWRTP